MPSHLRHVFDRLPIPSLRFYTFFSTSLLCGNFLYNHHLIQMNAKNSTDELIINGSLFSSNAKPFSYEYIRTLLSIMISQSLSLLVRKINGSKTINKRE